MTPLSPAQKRALDWLPSDGGWNSNPPSGVDEGLADLLRHDEDLVDVTFAVMAGPFFRATPAGIALKAEMEADRG